jgi:curved DNA binding protein
MDLELTDQLSNNNLDKYMTAGKIVSRTMDQVKELLQPGLSVKEVCEMADTIMLEQLENVYNKKSIKKGIAMPTSIGINNMIGYYSPLEDTVKLSDGDLVNIELGVHIDEFPAILGTTMIVCVDKKPTDEQINMLKALENAGKNVLKYLKPGKTNENIVKVLDKVSKEHNLSLPLVDNPDFRTPGIISYQMSKGVLDGKNDEADDEAEIHKMVLNRDSDKYEFDMLPTEFETNEVYAIDIVMTSGDGKLYCTEERVTVFRRNFEQNYNLKLKASRNVLNHFTSNFPMSCRDKMTTRFKLGVQECVKRGLLIPYAPFATKPGTYTAQLKFTVIIRKKKPILITKYSFN